MIAAVRTVPEDGIPTPEVCVIADVTFRMLDWWIKQGYVHAVTGDERRASGSGVRRYCTPRETDVARHMGALVKAGIAPAMAARAARAMVTYGRSSIALDERVGVTVALPRLDISGT